MLDSPQSDRPAPEVSSGPAPAPAMPSSWVICALLFWVALANFFDRTLFGNLAPELQRRFGWSPEQFWLITAAFTAAYALGLLVAGRLVNLLDPRWQLSLLCLLAAFASAAHALANSLAAFFALRILLGFTQGACLPALSRTIELRFSPPEQTRAAIWFNWGCNLGAALLPLGLPLLVTAFSMVAVSGRTLGWRGPFLVTAIFDLTWILAWLLLYRSPATRLNHSPSPIPLSHAHQLDSIRQVSWRALAAHRQTWTLAGAAFLTESFWWFLLLGAPCFLSDRFKLSLGSRTWPLVAIFASASAGGIAGNWLFGRLSSLRRSPTASRKLTLLLCAIAVFPVVFAAVTSSSWLAIALLALAALALQAWTANLVGLTLDFFPRRAAAAALSLLRFAGSAGATSLFLLVGCLRQAAAHRTDPTNYFLILLIAALSCLLALLLIQFPKPEPVASQDEFS